MYASVAQLRVYLPQAKAGEATDDALEEVLTRATGIVRDAMRAALDDPSFDYTAYGSAATKIVKGFPTQDLPLPVHQAASVTLVEEETSTNPAAYTTVSDQWLEEGGKLYRAGGWWFSRYRVTAVWGYGPTVPAAIEEVTLELAVNLWRRRDSGGYTELPGVAGQGAVRVVAGLTAQQQKTIDNVVMQLWQVSI